MSCSPHNLQLENPPFCKWISQPDPDKISPSSCQLSSDRFQLEEKFICYEALYAFCFDLSKRSQILGLVMLLWGTQCPPPPSVWFRLLAPPRKKLWVSYCKPGVQGSLHPRPGVTFQLLINVKMAVLQTACCLKLEFPLKVPAGRD